MLCREIGEIPLSPVTTCLSFPCNSEFNNLLSSSKGFQLCFVLLIPFHLIIPIILVLGISCVLVPPFRPSLTNSL